jgi:hypothetical protein
MMLAMAAARRNKNAAAALFHALLIAVTVILAATGGGGLGGVLHSRLLSPSNATATAAAAAQTAEEGARVVGVVSDGFVRWFQAHGGWMHPRLSLVHVPSYGGWGLVSDTPLAAHTPILRVPSTLILTRDRATRALLLLLHTEQPTVQPTDLVSIILEHMEDVEAMAVYLWSESCRHLEAASFWDPYLRMLPEEIPPLLFVMDGRALEILGDDDDGLRQLARHTSLRVEDLWKQFRPMLPEQSAPSCDKSLEGIRKYIAFVTSHGMLVGSQTILVPMADMINHNPMAGLAASDCGDSDSGNAEKQQRAFDFQHFHVLHGNGSMTITTDQSTIPVAVVDEVVETSQGDSECPAGVSTPTTRESGAAAECHSESQQSRYRHMVVEQYSEVDNSLYLEKFGFVPAHNEHHCVLLTLLSAEQAERDRSASTAAAAAATMPTACVKANGRLPTMQPSRDQSHEVRAMLELLRGDADSVSNAPRLANAIGTHEYESLQRCFQTATPLASTDQHIDENTGADRGLCDEVVVWQVWRRLVKRAATGRLADLQRRQKRPLSKRTDLSASVPRMPVQVATQFIQSDIDVLRSLTQLDESCPFIA